jgi:meso-butanediol dehydrogenase/(S,S)-butanediol dehydrogenase/diacetyl reductase
MNRFKDRVVLVTGAASGIGQASIERMASEGAHCVCVDLQEDAVGAVAEGIQSAGGDAIALVCDVADPSAIAQTVAAAIEHYGKLDSVCNSAGILHFDNSHELTLDSWNQVLKVNLTGTFLMCQAALPHLLQSAGNIVNIASIAGMRGSPWSAAYASSKGGVLALTSCLAVEYGRQGLRVNAVCPGSVTTPMHRVFKLPEGADGSLLQRITALDKMRGPEVVAGLVAFLASDDAAHVNGDHVRVDGGTLS